MPSWKDLTQKLSLLSERQLFFVGGAPRSGTTWLQEICDSHPEASCKGEGLFLQHLANPIERMMKERAQALQKKNAGIFSHTGGYPLPLAEHADYLIATGILAALSQQNEDPSLKAVGEKTPENVFLFNRLAVLFPEAKFVAIARDPRDVLTSAWHFFHKDAKQDDEAKTAFLNSAFPSISNGAKTMIAFGESYPDRYFEVTYEQLLSQPDHIISRLFQFLGLSNSLRQVHQSVSKTSFAAMTKDRPIGKGTFFRGGVSGDWRSTFNPEMNALILRELGWMFPHFGWKAD
jgi:hypothetical protein